MRPTKNAIKRRLAGVLLVVVPCVVGAAFALAANAATSSGRPSEVTFEQARADIIEQAKASSPGQAKLLEERVPTFDDYRQAVSAALECSRNAGVTVTEPVPARGGMLLEFSVLDTGDNPIERHDACYEQHALFIDIVYQLSIAPALFELDRSVVECIRAAGVDVSEVPDPVNGGTADASQLPLGMLMAQLTPDEYVKAAPCLPDR